MAKKRQSCIWFILLLVLLWTGVAWSGSISGTVTNNTGKSGRIYLSLVQETGEATNLGTSIGAAGPFTINGVDAGRSYRVEAFLDTQGTGIRHANDAAGSSSAVQATSGSVSVGTFSVTIPALTQPQAPYVIAYRGTGGNFLMWDGARDDNDLPIADKYRISWSSSPNGPETGHTDVSTGDKDFFVHVGGTAALYYQVTAWVGGQSASSFWTQLTPGAGGATVTGKILFPPFSSPGRLIIALVDEQQNPPRFHVIVPSNPISGGDYTATGVPPGTYTVFPLLDLNGNGTFDAGDIGPADDNDFNPTVTVASSAVRAPDATLTDQDASIILATSHGKSEQHEWYNLKMAVQSMKKHVVGVRLVSGPQIAGPVDIAWRDNDFQFWQNVGRPQVKDTYTVLLTYADGSSQTFYPEVTAVLDTFATPLAPNGYINDTNPTFSWTAPSPGPADYLYSIWVSHTEGYQSVWDAWALPKTQTSIVYGSRGDLREQLNNGASYRWSITVVDRNGNQAENQRTFSVVDQPAMNGFSPPGGLPGSTVTISGINFPADPAQHSVFFSSATGAAVPAVVTAATNTSVTVTVPSGAATGKISLNSAGVSLLSSRDFIVAAPVALRGAVKTTAETGIAGAKVELLEYPVSAMTAADGSFTLQPVFAGTDVTLKITRSGYVPTYTGQIPIQGNMDITAFPHHLYTFAELGEFGVARGKGALIGKVLNYGATPVTAVEGVVVSAGSAMGGYYPVRYFNGTAFAGSSATYSNGIFLVSSVNDYDWIELTASRSGWYFPQSRRHQVHADSVTEVGLFGSTSPPTISSFSPSSGKAGDSVTINGSYLSPDAEVRFNGSAATVTAGNAGSLTVTVPASATSGFITVTTGGGTAVSAIPFTRRYLLTASVSKSGGAGGTVYSIPAGITCRNAVCNQIELDQGTPVEMRATVDAGSRFTGWGGACSGTGSCSFSMISDRTVSATFEENLFIKKGSNYYSSLQNAFDAAATGETIQLQGVVLSGSVWYFNRPEAHVKLKGGYDSSFLNNTVTTILDGRLNVQGGTLRVEKVKVR